MCMKQEIRHTAIEKLYEHSKFRLEVISSHHNPKNQAYDGMLRFGENLTKTDFMFKVKKRLTLSTISEINTTDTKNTILIADYIPVAVKKYLKEKKQSYLDTTGNAFITDQQALVIYIETNKDSPIFSKKSNRAFSKSGLKMIYQILVDAHILNKPYRYIGEASQVSIDTVRLVLKDLLRDKYIVKVNEKEFKLINKEGLLQEWITYFNKILRPKLNQRNFNPISKNIRSSISPANVSIGGELAAEYLSDYLIAESAIIYTNKSFFELAKNSEWIPATDGKITLIEQFWAEKDVPEKTVNPILIYADLLNNPTPRNLETAEIIYNKHVKPTL
jgi:hypothetical protein